MGDKPGRVTVNGLPVFSTDNDEDDRIRPVPIRYNIRWLQLRRPEKFDLYILGLKRFYAQDASLLTSYYQIAGIHGLPGLGTGRVDVTVWPDWPTGNGYCPHSSIIFGPWHRPYLALYEQALYDIVQNVAQEFPEGELRDRYVEAAKDFRIPYFDWALRSPEEEDFVFPAIFTRPSITVADVDGVRKAVDNPLYNYQFPQDRRQELGTWGTNYKTTVRRPHPTTRVSQDDAVAPALNNVLSSVRSNLMTLLLSETDFSAFRNNVWNPNVRQGYNSLENIHDLVHSAVGGSGGHMNNFNAAAFDPFFWLHHANVDRLFAIWEALNPISVIGEQDLNDPRALNQNTPLKPFWDNKTQDYWTFARLTDTRKLGYAYPETQSWLYAFNIPRYHTFIVGELYIQYGNVFVDFVANNLANRREEHEKDMAKLSKKLASGKPDEDQSGVAADKGAAEEKPPFGVDTRGIIAAPGGEKPLKPVGVPKLDDEMQDGGPIPISLRHLAPNNTYTEWVVNVRAIKHGLGQSFYTAVFLGDHDASDPARWDLEFNIVGRVDVLERDPDECAKCKADAEGGLVVRGVVPLTSALLQDIVNGDGLTSLEPEHVVPYLKEKLLGRVALSESHVEVDAAAVPGLKVSVVSTKVTIDDQGIPHYDSEYTVWPEITEDRAGGIGTGEEA